MRSDENTLLNVKVWLAENQYTQAWLANQMGVAPSLISQLFNGERKLQPVHIAKMAEITGKTIAELASSEETKADELVYSLRGKISTEDGERGLAQLLLDVEHFAQLIVK
ncbi:helix-turn-helix transcriptional regulator [uncultured Trichococcus sp.]|uniref:helix-turn-helix domain-containing protein n=1 Tax=uncultured Trichococcus sp. TaxID=189665 RepID=UPI002A188B51|nr:helix-turn-helix transcriptional regulator [uncultured Trichococcus sp.]